MRHIYQNGAHTHNPEWTVHKHFLFSDRQSFLSQWCVGIDLNSTCLWGLVQKDRRFPSWLFSGVQKRKKIVFFLCVCNLWDDFVLLSANRISIDVWMCYSNPVSQDILCSYVSHFQSFISQWKAYTDYFYLSVSSNNLKSTAFMKILLTLEQCKVPEVTKVKIAFLIKSNFLCTCCKFYSVDRDHEFNFPDKYDKNFLFVECTQ